MTTPEPTTLREALEEVLAWAPSLTSPGYRKAAAKARAALATPPAPEPTTLREALTAAWWGVEHRCAGVERVYPVLHWADEPEDGAVPRRAFHCDACGHRYAFHAAPALRYGTGEDYPLAALASPPAALDVERLARALWNVLGWPEKTPFRETVAHEDGDNAHWNEMAATIAAAYADQPDPEPMRGRGAP